ncbi:MAG: YeeE/YedE family protein [Deltaproteobacteria bacterium]|nr:YeeE/YedE family protein [Deltaproteobacteria bacterium]
MKVLAALFSGILFGVGLAVSQMTNPAKVQAFLDVAGAWDPSLAFVMGAALVVSSITVAIARRRPQSLLGEPLQIPEIAALDLRLIAGAALFGVGWGLGGFCPGPALAGLATGVPEVWVFTASMLVGVLLYRWVYRVVSIRGLRG